MQLRRIGGLHPGGGGSRLLRPGAGPDAAVPGADGFCDEGRDLRVLANKPLQRQAEQGGHADAVMTRYGLGRHEGVQRQGEMNGTPARPMNQGDGINIQRGGWGIR